MSEYLKEAIKVLQDDAAACHRLQRDYVDPDGHVHNPECARTFQEQSAHVSRIVRGLMGIE